MASADDELVPGCRWRDLPVLCDNLRGIGPTGEVAAAVIVALAALRAAPTPEGETLLRETAGALWDLQSAPDCWCDTGEGNPHTEACMEATRVSRRLVAAKIHLSPASPAPTPATPKHGRSVPEGLCTACGTEPCAEHELPEPTPDGRETLDAALRLAAEATNGWACYAKRDIEHREIARLHHAIAALRDGGDQ